MPLALTPYEMRAFDICFMPAYRRQPLCSTLLLVLVNDFCPHAR